jgi:3-hydroxyisobutyrate dehydrogenase-like beta-hydroxyacid dehydrogenase
MGTPMASNILKAGFPVSVWNRNLSRAETLKQLGATVAQSPKAVADQADVIITMVTGPSAASEVILGKPNAWSGVIDGIRTGKVVVDMTTNLPSVSRQIAEQVRRKGGDMIDAPVSGSVKPATEGSLVILVGGRKETLERVRHVLEAMGRKIWYMGDNGMGCTMKLVLNMHLASMMVALAECLAFGVKTGLKPSSMLEVINNSPLKTYMSESKGPNILKADWTTAFSLSNMAKDLDLVEESARETKIPLPIASAVKQLYYAALTKGMGGLDFSAVTAQIEETANVKISEPH